MALKAGWRLLRVGVARRPEIFYVCEGCGTETWFPIGSFVGLPDPKCCTASRDYPAGRKVFEEFLTARPICDEREAEMLNAQVSSVIPRRSIIAVVAEHRGKKKKKS